MFVQLGKLRVVIAVSYTHLDVYKRQEQGEEAKLRLLQETLASQEEGLVRFKAQWEAIQFWLRFSFYKPPAYISSR